MQKKDMELEELSKLEELKQKLEEFEELEELKKLEKHKELEKKLEEACFKYLEAKYIGVPTKNTLCLVDALYEGDSFLLHLKFIEPSSSDEDPRIFRG